jgi:hypothetical protein
VDWRLRRFERTALERVTSAMIIPFWVPILVARRLFLRRSRHHHARPVKKC